MADKTLSQLIINKLTKAQYDALPSHSADELWFITGSEYVVASASFATSASRATSAASADSATTATYLGNSNGTSASFSGRIDTAQSTANGKWTYNEATIKAVKVNSSSYADNAGQLGGKAANQYASSSHTHTKSQITDFPTIPTVNDATITIQANGSSGTFTVNQSSNKTINLGTPTLVSSASYASTASYALNAQGNYLPITGGTITGSLYVNGALGQGGTGQGQAVTASGQYSHAQGAGTVANAIGAHAEGYETSASNQYSHAEGRGTIAGGDYAHAEGLGSKALALASHAEGIFNTASAQGQTVVGRYNAISSDYAFIVGNGTGSYTTQSVVPESRSNALGVRWDGNIDMQPGCILNGTSSATTMVVSSSNSIVYDPINECFKFVFV